MKNTPFIPPAPHIEPPSQDTYEKLASMTPKEHRKFKKSETYKKYVKPVADRDRKRCRTARQEWWWNKGIVIINTILALIAAVTGVIALLR